LLKNLGNGNQDGNMDKSHYFIQTSQGDISIWDSKPDRKNHEPAVILLHGHCTNKTFFDEQMRSPLLSKYRLIALDLPGYGKSPAPKEPEKTYSFPGFADVAAEVINRMALKNVVVVGWSLGGHVALELTSRLTQLNGILITGTPPIEISLEGLGKGFKVADPKILECFGKGNLSYEEAELLATISGYDYSEGKKILVDAILETDEGAKTIYPRSIAQGIGQNEVVIVGNWPHPIAVICGEQDAGINNEYIIHQVKFRNLWSSRVHVIPNAGHAVHMEQPGAFNAILKAFLDDVFSHSLL
jgi:pimeloyl-ACP methyl ester carboxylesterase